MDTMLQAEPANGSRVAPTEQKSRVKVLCVDDMPGNLMALDAMLADLDLELVKADSGAEALGCLVKQEHERQLAEAKERWEADRLKDEIRLARQIQQKLFPAAPLPLSGFDISGASFPAEATGGDYFDYIPMRDGGLAVVIGDVCGHGLGPALLMAEVRAYLRAFLLTRTDVGEILGLLNTALAEDAPEGYFATLLLARLDPASRSCVYASAGHMPAYIFGADGGIKAVLKATDRPLAIGADS